jgi:predicted site-specific integrase-resolvase
MPLSHYAAQAFFCKILSEFRGNEQQMRRGGLKNAMFEVDVQVDFYKMGFLSLFEMVRNVSVGFVVRMLPNALMKVVFKMIRKL